MSQRPHKIEDYGLEGKPLETRDPYMRTEFRYLEDYMGQECTWAQHKIEDPARFKGELVHTYSVSPGDCAYIVRNMQLTEYSSTEGSDVRRTDICALRWLAYHDIVNVDVRESIGAESREQKGEVVGRAVEVTPASYYEDFPVVESTLHLVKAIEELTKEHVPVKTIHLVSDDLTYDEGGKRHMVFEPGQQG